MAIDLSKQTNHANITWTIRIYAYPIHLKRFFISFFNHQKL